MSFGPFFGGKRICLGKTFVETMSKIIGPSIIGSFDFEFAEGYGKPEVSLIQLQENKVMVKVKECFL